MPDKVIKIQLREAGAAAGVILPTRILSAFCQTATARTLGHVIGIIGLVSGLALPARGVILWNEPDEVLVNNNGVGRDILRGAVKRDDSANDTLYFRFRVDPISDKDTEEYLAAFELFEGTAGRLGVGNALKAWAYSAFFHGEENADTNDPSAYSDLRSQTPEPAATVGSGSYQYPRRGVAATIVFKVQYVPGEDDLVTVWLNPDLGPGANESYQPEKLTTRFNANAGFDEIHLRHSGSGGGWRFSDLAIATSFSDFVDSTSARPIETAASFFSASRAFSFQSWQKEQGLPQTPVLSLLQTRDGYLWIGTEAGPVRFDGVRFVALDAQEEKKTGNVCALYEDRQGGLWVGGEAGLSCWLNGHRTAFPQGLPGKSITGLAEDSTGRLWVGTDQGLVMQEGGQFVQVDSTKPFNGQRIVALAKSSQGELWVAVDTIGVLKFTNDKFVPVTGSPDDELLKSTHCLLADRGGRMWIGAGEDALLSCDQGRWRRYNIPRNQARSYPRAIGEEFDGTVWVGFAGGGLLQFIDGRFVSVSTRNSLAGEVTKCFLSDQEGNLWIGTEAGLNCVRRKVVLALSQPEGLGLGPTESLAEVSPGVVWVAKPNDGIYRWDGRNFSRLSAQGLSSHGSQVTTLLVTHDGFCWVATTNNLLLYKDPIAAGDEGKIIDEAPRDIIALAEDREKCLWAGTRDGKLWQFRGARWEVETNLPQTKTIAAIEPDRDGSMWVGTEGDGLYLLTNSASHGVEKISGLESRFIRTLHLDSDGAVWIGTADQGLARWKNGKLANFGPRRGLPEAVSQILEDDTGRLWLGSDKGVACVEERLFDELASGKAPAVYPQVFRRAEGMLSDQCTGGFCPAGLKTKSGLLWFSTQQGVAVINPGAQPTVSLPPKPVVEEVVVDGTSNGEFQRRQSALSDKMQQEQSKNRPQPRLRISPGAHRLEFRYTGLSFAAPDHIRFRYRLEGLDNDWVDAGTRRAAFYSYLPPGNYRFHLAACNENGLWSESASGLALAVLPPFWQMRWFIVAVAIGLIALVVGAVQAIEKAKTSRRLKRLEQERALERERTRIAQDLHDQMGAKLCRISFLSEHARRGDLPNGELQEQITSISDASREVLQSLDEIVWAVNPQNDTLEHVGSYIGQYAEEYFQMTGIECELDIPTQLPPHPLSSQMRHHVFLAAHEALTNILKHSGATRARISMRIRDSAFEINICDNGKGFNSAAANLKADGPSSGDGLPNISRRLADVGGHCWVESEPGKGTRIGFVIPLGSFKNGK